MLPSLAALATWPTGCTWQALGPGGGQVQVPASLMNLMMYVLTLGSYPL